MSDDYTKEQNEAMREYRDTLYKMTGMNSFAQMIEEAAALAISNFGMADQLYCSPKQIKDFKGLMAQIDDS